MKRKRGSFSNGGIDCFFPKRCTMISLKQLPSLTTFKYHLKHKPLLDYFSMRMFIKVIMIETISIINTCWLAAPHTRFCFVFCFIYYVKNVLCEGNLNYKHNASKVSSSLLQIIVSITCIQGLAIESFFLLLLYLSNIMYMFCYLVYALLCNSFHMQLMWK